MSKPSFRKYLVLIIGLCLTTLHLSGQIQSNKRLRDSLLMAQDTLLVDSLVARYLAMEGISTRQHNSLTLLASGQQKFDDLFVHLRSARKYIHMEYFNFRNDSISHQVFDLLRHKCDEGVEVRVLFDAFGNMSNDQPLKNRHLDSLRSLGLNMVKFDPIRFPWVNHVATRDHRKLVIIDGKIAYLGGMNIADYYIKGLEKIGSWRDMHCRIEGDAVQDVEQIFARMWAKATKEELPDSLYTSEGDTTDSIRLAVVDRSPKTQPDAIKDAYALAISGAHREVNIVNPYFVPTKSIMRAVQQAIDKGVQVNIMVSERSDIPFTPEAMKHKLRKLAKRGAKVYLYREGFHHAKVMTVDGRLSTIGSANLNSRSLRYDYETNVFVFDRGITAQLDSIYASDKSASIMLDDEYWRKRSLWKKFVGWFANLFTPFL